jgi:acetylcholinesterase
MATYLINFVNNFTPNGPGGNLEWPAYTTESPELMTFLDDESTPLVVSPDTYREKAIEYLIQLDFGTSS